VAKTHLSFALHCLRRTPYIAISLWLVLRQNCCFSHASPGFPLCPPGILAAKLEFSPYARAVAMSCLWLSPRLRLLAMDWRHPLAPNPFSHATVSPHYIRKLAACWFLLVSVGQSNCDFFADTFDGFMRDVARVWRQLVHSHHTEYIPICGTTTTGRQVDVDPSYKHNLNKLIELSRVKQGQGKLVRQLNFGFGGSLEVGSA